MRPSRRTPLLEGARVRDAQRQPLGIHRHDLTRRKLPALDQRPHALLIARTAARHAVYTYLLHGVCGIHRSAVG